MGRSLRSWWRHWLNHLTPASRPRPRPNPWRRRPFLEALEDRTLLSAFVVTSAADDGSAGTLRAAINAVNAGQDNVIDFQIGAVGSAQTINPTSVLPAITANGVSINGLSQGGNGNVTPLIELNGASAGPGAVGLLLDASNCTISGLIIEGFSANGIQVKLSNNTIGGTTAGSGNILANNGFYGVLISAGVSGVQVQGNNIGLLANVPGNSIGVEVFGSNNTIGGTIAGASNLISGNTTDGVQIFGSGVQVQGNLIGLNGTQSTNQMNGIVVSGSNNTIGGTSSAARNIISGNAFYGVLIGPSISGVAVQGNYIGTNPAGTSALGNGGNGIEVSGSNNTIGGTATGAGNVISGNNANGVAIGSGISNIVVRGNSIGTNAAGASTLANGGDGVQVLGSNNTIGGTIDGARNLISGNTGAGVLSGPSASAVVVQGNFIGTNAAGNSALGNSDGGVIVNGSNNTIGGTVKGTSNLIFGNSGDGVLIGKSASGVAVQGNSIGINAATGARPNHATGVEVAGSNNTIGGTMSGSRNILSGNGSFGVLIDSGASGVAVQGNFIGTNGTATSAVANGIGVLVKGSNDTIGGATKGTSNVISGNGTGVTIEQSASGVVVQGNFIGTNAAATSAIGNSIGVMVSGSNNLLGGTTGGAGNVISGNGLGVVIGSGVSGTTVQGNRIGTNAAGTSALGNSGNGIEIGGSNNTIGGTTAPAGNVISGNGTLGLLDGVLIDSGVSGVVVQGNFIGTNAAGTSALGNSGNGIEVEGSNNTIGGTTAAARNVISENHLNGVRIDSTASGVQVQGNYIGTSAAGTLTTPGDNGVEVLGSNNTIGGTTAGAGNLISGNARVGVVIVSSASGTQVQGNFIGTNPAGTSAVANGIGVTVFGPNSTIGGTTVGASNLISGNTHVGLQIGATGVVVQGNFIGTEPTGTTAVGNGAGIEVVFPTSTIGGTTTAARNLISGNISDGVLINTGASGVVVQGNFIGTDNTGTIALSNGNGVEIAGSSNTLGGATAGSSNLISGNTNDGIVLDSSSSGNQVEGNTIGLSVSGGSLGNSGNGIEIAGALNTVGGSSAAANLLENNANDGILFDGSSSNNQVQGNTILNNNLNGIEVAGTGNTIGGSTSDMQNLVSANAADGILLDASANSNQVLGNNIGVNAAGNAAQANGTNGVEIQGTANTIGSGNIISGNPDDGVLIDSGASGNQVQGNDIGVAGDGATAIANGINGVEVLGSANTIGGTSAGARNIIAANPQDGVLLNTTASGNAVQGNYIGLTSAGNALGDSGHGVEVLGTANTVGGASVGARNVIAANLLDGVLLNTTADGNAVEGNYIGTTSDGTAALGNDGSGIEVLGNNNTLGGTTAGARNVIAANLLDGVLLGTGGSGNQVQGNYIGPAAGGTTALGNGVNGVEVQGNNNTIGGSVLGAGNVVSGNPQDGVLIDGGATGNHVQGNKIGTSANGSAALANSGNGIEVAGLGNIIGGSTARTRNVISGNSDDGVLLDSGAGGAVVEGNYIGTDATGKLALGNGASGVEVDANGALIGGSSVAFRNVISGNNGDGVLIDSGTSGVVVQGNLIGSDFTGSVALGNAEGIEIAGSGNTIGGTMAAARNVISGNHDDGVLIDSGANGNAVQNNFIGVNLTASAALANGGYGVNIAGSNNSIGTGMSAASNTIADNSLGGVFVSAGSGNTIRHNAIYANAGGQSGKGIVLTPGSNNNVTAPMLNKAVLVGSTLTVTGTFTALQANVPYVLEFFANPTGDAEGKVFLGEMTVTPMSTGTLAFTFTTTTSVASTDPLITATLTDAAGDTSAFSPGVTAS